MLIFQLLSTGFHCTQAASREEFTVHWLCLATPADPSLHLVPKQSTHNHFQRGSHTSQRSIRDPIVQ